MKRLLLLLVFVGKLFAQAPATVTGTVYDAGGNVATSGSVIFQVMPQQGAYFFVQGSGTIVPTSTTCTISGTGTINCPVWGNDVISPDNTCYQEEVQTPTSDVVIPTLFYIAGGSYNIGSPVFCTNTKVTPQGTTLPIPPVQGPLIPGADNAFSVGAPGFRYSNGYFYTLNASNILLNGSPIAVSTLVNVRSYGATGNGSTDDTASFQSAINAAIAANTGLYIPTGTYLVTKSLNATTTTYAKGFWIVGDGQEVSSIVHALTEPYPVIDFGGCTYCGMSGVGMYPKGSSYSNSQATTGVFVSKGTCGSAGSTGCTIGSTYGDVFTLMNSFIEAGGTSTTSGVQVLNSDLFECRRCQVYSNGTALVDGTGLGDASSVGSKFYTLPTTTDSTFANLHSPNLAGGNAAFEMTGAQAYHAFGGYFAVTGTATSGKIIYNVGNSGLHNGMYFYGIRTENQSSSTGVVAVYNNQSSNNGHIDGVLNSDSSAGIAFGSSTTGTMSNYDIHIIAGTKYIVETLGQFIQSELHFYTGSSNSFGSMTGSSNHNLTIVADAVGSNFTWSTVLQAISNSLDINFCQSGDKCYSSSLNISNYGSSFGNIAALAGSGGYARLILNADTGNNPFLDFQITGTSYWNVFGKANSYVVHDSVANVDALTITQGTQAVSVAGALTANSNLTVNSGGNSFVLVRGSSGGYAKVELIGDTGSVPWFDIWIASTEVWSQNFRSTGIVWDDVVNSNAAAMTLIQGTDVLNVLGGYQSNGTTVIDGSANGTFNQITSTVTTGTAPLVITSTTPVAHLSTVPTTYNAAGTQQTNVHIVADKCILGTSCSVTLSGSAAFTSSSSYQCSATDETATAAVKFAPSSGSAFVLTGTGTDTLSYHCVGN